jgi:dimethylargininase
MRTALVREISPAFARCELTHLPRVPIDIGVAREQHRRYEDLLSRLGYAILRLPADPQLPDSVFVEDAAVILDELAVVCRPGAASRRPEVESVADALAPYRRLARIQAPAVLDGGDVLRIGRTVYVGLSGRTDRRGADQLREILGPADYEVRDVPVTGCLHLKSAVTQVAPDTLLLQPDWLPRDAFAGMERVEVDPSEPLAANALRLGDRVIYPAAFPKTRQRLENLGLRLVDVDLSEIAKAEGAVTCCSLILDRG